MTWASHLALTDRPNEDFWYDQRSEIGPQVDVATGPGFDFSLRGTNDQGVPDLAASAWQMSGSGGHDMLTAATSDFGIDFTLSDTRAAPVLHDGDGWVDFSQAGGSYYYSRPRMDLTGTLTFHDRPLTVTGEAWFDHQWGDFIAVGGGGWDWFAVNLDDGTDLTVSLVRAADGSYPLVYGTLVAPDDTVTHLASDAFTLTATGSWTSSHSGATYPAGWRLSIPSQDLEITLQPTVPDQELDTRATTGVIYWEGSQHVDATRGGSFVDGQGYVELTGYAARP